MTVSVKTFPDVVDPSPYEIEKLLLGTDLLDDDEPATYFFLLVQAVEAQSWFGTQRSLEPVSKSMRKD